MLAMAVLTLDRFEAALKQADINAALTLEAFCGRSDAFDARAHALRPHPGQVATAANIRALTAGSGFVLSCASRDAPVELAPREVVRPTDRGGHSAER